MNLALDVVRLLQQLAVPAALVALLLAGLALRREHGLAIGPGGAFGKWVWWSAVMLTLPQLLGWFSLWGIVVPSASGSPSNRVLFNVGIDIMTFVNLWLIDRFVPVLAAFFVLRASIAAMHGESPLPSVFAAMFLLAILSTRTLLDGWGGTSNYATVETLAAAWTYLTARVMPVASGLAVCAAILNFAAGRPALRIAGCAAAFLILPAIWRLVVRMM